MYANVDGSGNVLAIGDRVVGDEILGTIPDDWFKAIQGKYLLVDGHLIAVDGWVAPTPPAGDPSSLVGFEE